MFKTLYIILICLIYLLTGSFITTFFFDEGVVLDILVIIFSIIGSISILYMISIIIVYLVKAKKVDISPKFIMINKITLVPFYLFFFVIGILLVFGYLIPNLWFVFVITLAYIVGGLFGYLLLITTSIPNIYKLFREVIGKKNHNLVLILSLIFHFIFVLDIVGSILFKNKLEERDLMNPQVN